MRHGAESPRPIVPDTCGFYGVVRLLIVGSNPSLTTKFNIMEKWNRDDFQGKRKDQVDFSTTVTVFTVILGLGIGIVVGLLYLCNII
jgi:hypothetical protein